MLELTRRLSQGVRLGTGTTLTVIKMLPGLVHLQIEYANVTRVIQLERGHCHTQFVDGVRVQVQLISVLRGVARLGFEAPRRLRIDRIERVEGGPI